MAEGDVRQYFVRNETGMIWGPLALPTIELLIDNGSIQGRLQVSEDGINFAFPGLFPHIRDAFPREMWGDVVVPGPTTPMAPAMGAAPTATPTGPQGKPAPGVAPRGPAGAPMAGPGAVAATRPGAPVAGPGARPAAPPGAVPPGAPPGAARPPGSTLAPGMPGAVPTVAPRPGAPGAAPQRPPAPATTARPVGPGIPTHPAPGTAPQAAAPGAPAAARPVPPGATPQQAPAPATTARPVGAGIPTHPAPTAATGPAEVPPSSGQLETHSLVRLYGLLAAGNHTGLLTLTLADCTVSLHFRKGNPEFIDSSHPEDALSTSLLQAKLVTPEQLQQAEAARGRFGGELLAALFGLGLLQPPSAFTQLAHRAQTILLKGLRAESGAFTFEPKDLPAAKAMPLGNKWAVLSDLVRRLPSADLRRRLQPVLGLPVMKSNGRVATGDLRLTPHEMRVLALIDGVRSTGQLLTDVPQDADHVLRLVFLLKELDGVSFAAVAQRAAPPPQASAPRPAAPAPGRAVTAPGVAQAGATPQPAAPAPGRAVTAPGVAQAGAPAPGRAVTAPGVAQAGATPQAPRPATAPAAPVAKPAAPTAPAAKPAAPATPVAKPAAPAMPAAKPAAPAPAAKPAAPAPAPAASGATPGANEIPVLRELAEKLKEQNHFERLGLGADTNGPAVKIAYFKLARLYHPDTLPPGAPPELEKLKADVFAYIGEAYRALADDKSRAAYIEELKHGGGKQEQQVDVEAILKSEELFRKAGLHIKARKFAEAVKILDEAIQLNGEEPEFYAWRGYARFFTFEDKKVAYAEAFKDIQACLKKNEKVASAHYFLGVIAKLCGDNSGALKHFQRTVEIQPNHIDAQREIRMAAQKK
ncbi:J domain-containing protein [Archangium lipolyticum]|uniref:J domain-containing protein n=1 Tax=Archangium lipolyticum TaxID=2970465 RepID=UPI002149FC88|nr:DUF4388 domain-containing protein [Archangium lipolyticum]